ncbi:LysR family transcriptional regulator [Burkholderia sp. WAC0059]|nr:LysR family transcriptional regulator [Burkholderia sp. WAC0059]
MLDELKSFVAVVDDASLTRAADRLCVSQSTVSKRIQRLEALLGTALFDRNSKPPKPTAVASRIYGQVVPLLRGFEQLFHLANEDAPPSGLLRFGFPQVVADMALPDAVTAMKAAFPALDVRWQTDWTTGLLRRLETGALDAAVLMLATGAPLPDELAARRMLTFNVVVVQSRDKPLVKGRMPIRSLADCEWILNPEGCGYRAALERAMAGAGAPLRLGVDTHAGDMQMRLVSAGLGLGLVPREMLEASPWKSRLAVVDVRDFALTIDVWLAHPHAVGNLRRAVEVLADAVSSSLARPRAARRSRRG